MLDIETLDTKSTALPIQIGAHRTGLHGPEKFLVSLCEDSLDRVDPAWTVSEQTQKWWSEQSVAAQEALTLNTVPRVQDMLEKFVAWLGEIKFDKCHTYPSIDTIWANPPSFDLEILRHSFHACRLDVPWHHRQERDYRTMSQLFPGIRLSRTERKKFIKHRADHDAARQHLHLHKMLSHISDLETFKENIENIVMS